MKRMLVLLLSICFIGACANREENQQAHESETQIPVEQANQHDNGTAMEQTEVLQQIKDQIQADFTIKMPTTLPITQDSFYQLLQGQKGIRWKLSFMKVKRVCRLMIFD